MSAKLQRCDQVGPNDPEYLFRCPACESCHWFKTTGSAPVWTFNGELERPTVQPSIRVDSGDANGPTRCHFFITGGMIAFCPDSTHNLAGQTVPLPDFDE